MNKLVVSIFADFLSMSQFSASWLAKVRYYLFLVSDFFYPIVSSFCSIQIYRYGFFGLANLTFDTILFVFLYYVVFESYIPLGIFPLGIIDVKLHVFVLSLTMPTTIVTGFFLMRYIVFDDSRKGHLLSQFLKYVLASLTALILNYVFLRLFVEWLEFSVDISKISTTLIVVLYSFLFQRNITFRKKKRYLSNF